MSLAIACPTVVLAAANKQLAQQPRPAPAQAACFVRRPKFGTSLTSLASAKGAATSSRVCICSATATTIEGSGKSVDAAPQPTVKIDNLTDPLSTIVIVEFGDYLGELVDTMNALRGLGLNITKAKLTDGVKASRFFVTDSKTSEKVIKSARLEEIKSTIFSVMMDFHPEAKTILSSSSPNSAARKRTARKADGALGLRPLAQIPTSVKIFAEESGSRSRLDIVTTDRQGLLVDVVKTLKDISVNVVSAEIDTIGIMAHDIFFLTYQGQALDPNMDTLVVNSLQYFLSMTEIAKEESY
mmetsp:Transcript_40456/g.67781  ORF Transcript_40456/g.67781 Transcript_40456/m.67781 type:complete len:298 (-) Transcript_40456:374-1267(-)|eukprot:CAMPEP_0198200622 /NCGR_PEP_ID=MMETSP1445-20131203/3612_1 /TAXON_ID=36898 /ORGANISM="Pyramimonas sp., Strain CCMP2087" /LENGTH=297 /DNA_ID=CAMNT_0043870745 /DNA_START=101 /DNA_END=994 /DNA_ORIENTATION=+